MQSILGLWLDDVKEFTWLILNGVAREAEARTVANGDGDAYIGPN